MANPQQSPPQQSTQGEASSEQQGATGSGVSVRREPSLASWFGQPFTVSPFGVIRRMMEDLDRVFGDLGAFAPAAAEEAQAVPVWSPQVEVFQRGDELVVRADLPGLREEDVNITATDEALVIEGERRFEREGREGGVYRSEVRYGSFRRAIPLPEGADLDSASARFQDGVLEVAVKVPVQQREARRIEIKTGTQPPETEEGKSVH